MKKGFNFMNFVKIFVFFFMLCANTMQDNSARGVNLLAIGMASTESSDSISVGKARKNIAVNILGEYTFQDLDLEYTGDNVSFMDDAADVSTDGKLYESVPSAYASRTIIEEDFSTPSNIRSYNAIVNASPIDSSGIYNEITIFTPGIGGNANAWSNQGTTSYTPDSNSLPFLLASKFGSQVYLFKPDASGLYKFYQSPLIGALSLVSCISDISNPLQRNIVIFSPKSTDSVASNDTLFSVFMQMINALKGTNDSLSFNLIGHSRGGLINMMFANNEPSRVKKFISLGTPYFPNAAADLITILDAYGNVKGEDLTKGPLENHPAYDDIDDDVKLAPLRSTWNQNVSNGLNNFSTFLIGAGMELSLPIFFPVSFSSLVAGRIVRSNYLAKATLPILVPFDGLVSTPSQIGNGLVTTQTNILGTTTFATTVGVNSLYNVNTSVFYVSDEERQNAKTDHRLAEVDSISVPHNMEPFFPPMINYILNKF